MKFTNDTFLVVFECIAKQKAVKSVYKMVAFWHIVLTKADFCGIFWCECLAVLTNYHSKARERYVGFNR